jgi:large subunit ribosomal protein L25
MSQVLEAQTGREQGSRPSGRLRRSGVVPGVLYGLGLEPVVLSIEWPALRRALNAEGGVMSAPIRLRVNGQEHLTLVKELQRHPVRRDVLHIDFMAVDPDEEVTVEVPLVLSRLEELGASLVDKVVLLVHRLQVTSKPNAIPTEMPIDVSNIQDGQQIFVSDLRMPAGVTTDTDPHLVVAVCGKPTGAGGYDDEGDAADAGAGEAGEADAEAVEGSGEE